MKLLPLFALLVVCAGTGCGDGDDGPTPAMKCDAFVDRFCGRLIECKAPTDPATIAECVAALHTVLPCAQADRVSDGYESCMEEVRTSPCTVLYNSATGEGDLPATCNGSILFKQ